MAADAPSPSRLPWLRRALTQLAIWLPVLLLLWWVLRNVPLADVLGVLQQLTALELALLLVVNAAVLLLFGGRWWALLRQLGWPLPYVQVAMHRLAGFGVSYFTPGPQVGGEPAQVRLLHVRHGLPFPPIFASIGTDRLIEFAVNLLVMLTGLVLTLRSQIGGLVSGVSLAAVGAVFVLEIAFFALLWRGHPPVTRVLARLPSRWREHPRLVALRDTISETETQAIDLFQNHLGGLLLALGFSLASWVGIIVEYWLIAHFLGETLGPLQLVAALTAFQVSFLLPLPGGLGALEAGQVFVYTQMGLDPAVGLSVSLFMRARDVAFGAIGLLWAALKWQGKDRS